MSIKDTKSLFKGKETYKEELNEAKAIKSGKVSPKEYAKQEGKEVNKMASGGRIDGVAERGHTKGKMYAKGGKCMAEGGRTRKQISDDYMSEAAADRAAEARAAKAIDDAKPYTGRANTQGYSSTTGLPLKNKVETKAEAPKSKATETKPKPKARASRETTSSRASRQAAYDAFKSSQSNRAELLGSVPDLSQPDDSTSDETFKKGGKAKCYAAGGITRADGCAQRGKTRGKYI